MENFHSQEGVLDKNWYEKLSTLAFEDHNLLGGEKDVREKAEEDFISDKVRNPILDYPKLDLVRLDEKEKKLLDLKKEILEQEENEVIKKAYRWKINEMIAQVRMLKCTKEGNDQKFARYSKFIYGEPSEDIFKYELQKRLKRIKKFLLSEDEGRKKAAEELMGLINLDVVSDFQDVEESPVFVPKPEEKDKTVVTSIEAKALFDEAIKKMNIPNWKVVVDTEGNSTSFSANQASKEIIIPSDEQLFRRSNLLDKGKIENLIAHELGVHAVRRERGERSKLQLLAIGLDRYIKGEEGIATYEEQLVKGADDYAGEVGHFSLSLAMGLDGKKRDFREVFEIMKRFSILLKKESVDREALASQSAFRQCLRIFKGSTCNTPGVVYGKDMSYREGNIGIWNLVNSKSEECHRFMIGKYDPTNSRHIYILDQLGITEDDLKDLEG